jgi:CcmD family protein
LIALAMGVLYSIVAAGSMAAARSYLYAAYCATWLIHGVYLGSLVRRFNRLQRQMKDLQK